MRLYDAGTAVVFLWLLFAAAQTDYALRGDDSLVVRGGAAAGVTIPAAEPHCSHAHAIADACAQFGPR